MYRTPSSPCLRLLACLCVLVPSAWGSEWFVATDGDDGADGRIATRPLRTIDRALARCVPGDVVSLRGGTYRQTVRIAVSGTATQPIVLRAFPGEQPVLKGSQVVQGWTRHAGAVWKRGGWSVNSQQVFDDGVPLQQIGVPSSFYAGRAADGSTMIEPVGSGLADLVPGSFWYDAAARTLYLRLADDGDPADGLVEVSTAHRILSVVGDTHHVVVRGLAFRHSSTAAYQYGGAAIELGDDCSLEQCDVQWCDLAGISPGWARSRARIVDCVASNNGDIGMLVAGHAGFLISGCSMERNNYRGFVTTWQAGGVKITAQSHGTIERCVVRANRGMGIWFDYADSGQPSTCRGNLVCDQFDDGEGIIVEASRNVLVSDNVVAGNERRGIYVSASDQVRVLHNTLHGNRGYAALETGGMPRPGKTLRGIEVRNNLLSGNRARYDLSLARANGGDVGDVVCDGNGYHREGQPLALRCVYDARGGYAGVASTSLAAWRAATTFDANGIQADPRFTAAASLDFRLRADSPAIDAGLGLAAGMDHAGRPRPQGDGPDLGAFEWVASDAPPSIVHAASAAPAVVEGTSCVLSVLAADDGGEAWLAYTWTAMGDAPAGVAFSANGGNAAKLTTATFARAGQYLLQVEARDAGGQSALGTVAVRVAQRPAALRVQPAAAELAPGDGLRFRALVEDQFAEPLAEPPPVAWTAHGGDIDADGLHRAGAAGDYAVAAAAGGLAAEAMVSVGTGFTARVHFRPATAPAMPGWLADSGEPFGDRGNGRVHGWSAANDTTRDRNRARSPDQLHDTLIHLQKGGADLRWEIQVPAGRYAVRVLCGDAAATGGACRVAVEGVLAVEGTPSVATPWFEGTCTVQVADGRLTVGNAPGAVNNRLCAIEIIAVPEGNG